MGIRSHDHEGELQAHSVRLNQRLFEQLSRDDYDVLSSDVDQSPILALAARDFDGLRERLIASDVVVRIGGDKWDLVRISPAIYNTEADMGRLAEVLAQLAEFCQSQYRIRSRVATVLTYPCIMLAVGMGVVVFLLTFVVPRVTSVLQDNNVPLPTSTAILVGVGSFLQDSWPMLLVAAIIAYFLIKAAAGTERGGWILDSVKLKIPLLGQLLRKQGIARFSATLAALLRSGLPALDALGIVREVVGNRVLARAIDDITEAVTAGQDLSSPLRRARVFPPMVSYMVATGEQSGKVDEVLERVAEELDEEVEITGQRLIALLEPLMIVMMAVVVAFIVLSIVQPILELSNF